MTRTPDIPDATWEKMNRVFAAYPELTAVTLFGSRATGQATPRSDFDLITHGIEDRYRLGRLALDLKDGHSAVVRRASLRGDHARAVAAAYRCVWDCDLPESGRIGAWI